MCDMNQPTLPIVDPTVFITIDGAAEVLGVSRATVTRMVDRGLLSPYWPAGGRTERRPVLLSSAEVEQLRAARKRAGVTGRG